MENTELEAPTRRSRYAASIWLNRLLQPLIIQPQENSQNSNPNYSRNKRRPEPERSQESHESESERDTSTRCCFRIFPSQREPRQNSQELRKTHVQNALKHNLEHICEAYLPSRLNYRRRVPPRCIIDPVPPDRSIVIRYYSIGDDDDDEKYRVKAIKTPEQDRVGVGDGRRNQTQTQTKQVKDKNDDLAVRIIAPRKHLDSSSASASGSGSGGSSSSSESVSLSHKKKLEALPNLHSLSIKRLFESKETPTPEKSNAHLRFPIFGFKNSNLRTRIIDEYQDRHFKPKDWNNNIEEDNSYSYVDDDLHLQSSDSNSESNSDPGADIKLPLRLRHKPTFTDDEKLFLMDQRRKRMDLKYHPMLRIPHDDDKDFNFDHHDHETTKKRRNENAWASNRKNKGIHGHELKRNLISKTKFVDNAFRTLKKNQWPN